MSLWPHGNSRDPSLSVEPYCSYPWYDVSLEQLWWFSTDHLLHFFLGVEGETTEFVSLCYLVNMCGS